MKKADFKRSRVLPTCAVTVLALVLCFSFATSAYAFRIDVSPNIINIASERLGEIRIFTNMRYSTFKSNTSEAYIYVNDCDFSVDNIRATRDSWGNLILKFDLVDLLALEDSVNGCGNEVFNRDADNTIRVVLGITYVDENGDSSYVEYEDQNEDVYIVDKKGR